MTSIKQNKIYIPLELNTKYYTTKMVTLFLLYVEDTKEMKPKLSFSFMN